MGKDIHTIAATLMVISVTLGFIAGTLMAGLRNISRELRRKNRGSDT